MNFIICSLNVVCGSFLTKVNGREQGVRVFPQNLYSGVQTLYELHTPGKN